MATRGASGPSLARNGRPFRIGVPMASKKPGETVRTFETTTGSPGFGSLPSAITFSCGFPRVNGALCVSPTARTPGIAATRSSTTIVEAANHLGVVITRIWRLQSRHENILGAKSRIDREKSLEALEKQPGSGEQHQRQRELDDHERIAHASRAA